MYAEQQQQPPKPTPAFEADSAATHAPPPSYREEQQRPFLSFSDRELADLEAQQHPPAYTAPEGGTEGAGDGAEKQHPGLLASLLGNLCIFLLYLLVLSIMMTGLIVFFFALMWVWRKIGLVR
ncbi:hypothetical protein F4820DRAFT_443346 [Hypoxylon rubiginosum]|uniref:Uncharacterized protein n=1 Tax=Hypoxylon rubiginosum TaxID=110542 RepID=A0ACB9ZFF8_9PEZI|nr:hypothetical protein F4820DRAFT_443346 [Hypoxylon rubiginosum]